MARIEQAAAVRVREVGALMIDHQLDLHPIRLNRDAEADAEVRRAGHVRVLIEKRGLARVDGPAPRVTNERRDLERVVGEVAVTITARAAVAPRLREERRGNDQQQQNENDFTHGVSSIHFGRGNAESTPKRASSKRALPTRSSHPSTSPTAARITRPRSRS